VVDAQNGIMLFGPGVHRFCSFRIDPTSTTITTNMKSSGTRTSERLSRKRQRLDEEEKKTPAVGGLRPKIGGRPNDMDCGILPSE